MSPFIGIIIAIVWFIYSAISKSKKEQQKKQQQKPLAEQQPVDTNKKQTFKEIREIMEDMRRQLQQEESKPQTQRPVVEYTEQKTPRQITNRQILVQDRNLVSETENQEASEYRDFVNKQRAKKYVFVNDSTQDDPQVTLMQDEDVIPLDYELDLKNIVIADVIMRRPEY